MKAIFYVLSILVIGAAAYFAFDNKSKLEAEMAKYEELNTKRTNVAATIKKTEGTLDDTEKALSNAKDKNEELKSTKDNEEAKERSLRASLEKVETRIEEAEAALAEFDEAQKKIEEALKGVNVPFDQIESKIAELEDERKDQQKKFDELLVLEEKLTTTVAANREEIGNLVSRLDGIRQRLARNGIAGTVTSVDPVWGFVIINLGAENSNITPESDLLVTRSGRLLGKLKVTSLEPTQTICDLDLKALRPGQRVQPGDKVILGTTVGN